MTLIDLPPITPEERREGVLGMYIAGHPGREIAEAWECEIIDVARIVKLARAAGDPRAAGGVELEMSRAKFNQEAVISEWRAGKSIEQIAKTMRLPPAQVRASVYLAIKDGTAGGPFTAAAPAEPEADPAEAGGR